MFLPSLRALKDYCYHELRRLVPVLSHSGNCSFLASEAGLNKHTSVWLPLLPPTISVRHLFDWWHRMWARQPLRKSEEVKILVNNPTGWADQSHDPNEAEAKAASRRLEDVLKEEKQTLQIWGWNVLRSRIFNSPDAFCRCFSLREDSGSVRAKHGEEDVIGR